MNEQLQTQNMEEGENLGDLGKGGGKKILIGLKIACRIANWNVLAEYSIIT
jgi:hypothetical protein